MTEEDKKRISKYMGWSYRETDDKKWWNIIGKDGATHLLDANDAAICVQEMQKRGDVGSFIQFSWGLKTIYPERRNSLLEYIPYIFNAENFFNAMSEWLKERGK
ncbi:MAG: hypothetical protein WC343_06030 [Bacilli bacterium]